jgi:hypothetical protein
MFQRRGTKQQWESTNPVLAVGEIGFSFNENVIKLGDGITAWNSLPSVNGNSAYQVAKANGYTGTESQWLASLVGPTGPTGGVGPQGLKGDKGDTGDVGPAVTSMSSSVITTTVSDKSSNYTILTSDRGSLIRSTGSAITITINNVLAIGENISFAQYGSGQITFLAGSGVTLKSKGDFVKTSEQYAAASVFCVASGEYWLVGSLV